MAPQKTVAEDDVPVKRVNHILQNLRLVLLDCLDMSHTTHRPQRRTLQTRAERAGQACIQ